jgi:hypothetical protein
VNLYRTTGEMFCNSVTVDDPYAYLRGGERFARSYAAAFTGFPSTS